MLGGVFVRRNIHSFLQFFDKSTSTGLLRNEASILFRYQRHSSTLSYKLRGNSSKSWRCTRSMSATAGSLGEPELDVIIVGGGIMGYSTAFFLSQRMSAQRICVIERDQSYSQSSTVLSACSIRQQFSLPENIQMAMFGYQFISELDKHLSVQGCDPPDVLFKPTGYLFLSTQEGEKIIQENHQIQRNWGANVALLSTAQLKEKYPWLNTEGITVASLGLSCEGYFDAYSLLSNLKRKVVSMGVQCVDGEVCDVKTDQNLVTAVQVRTSQGTETLGCRNLVNAAGAWARHIAEMAGLNLPVEARERMIFAVDCPRGPEHVPMLIDPSGFYVRTDGGNRYITGKSPSEEGDMETSNLDVDYDFFMEDLWPLLAHRIPAFEELKILSAWAGFYEMNTLDHNAIIGPHPDLSNFYFINGFSGHGLQQAPAAGRAISELIMDGHFETLDLTKFGYHRISQNQPFYERNII